LTSKAENAEKYLHKGSKVYIEGKYRTRKWQDKEGNDRYTTEIVADHVEYLDGKPQDGQGAAPQQQQRQTPPQGQRGGFTQGLGRDDDLGPAFPSEASGMDDVPF